MGPFTLQLKSDTFSYSLWQQKNGTVSTAFNGRIALNKTIYGNDIQNACGFQLEVIFLGLEYDMYAWTVSEPYQIL